MALLPVTGNRNRIRYGQVAAEHVNIKLKEC